MLYHQAVDIEVVKTCDRQIAAVEIGYRGIDFTADHILDDTMQTALILARRDNQLAGEDPEKYEELFEGIRQFGYFVYNGNFRIDDAILAASKAAWLAAIIKTD